MPRRSGMSLRRAGLIVSTLNVVGDATFDPFGGPDALETTIDGLAAHMRWAAAMGAPRVLIWEGRVDAARRTSTRPAGRLRRRSKPPPARSGLAIPPPVSCELHPFTFALKHKALPELAAALDPVGAGICFDFCHFGVALGRDLLRYLDDDVVAAIDHVHYSDTDTKTSELHFPPGEGVLDLDAIGARIAGKPIALSWDLFGWPGPRRVHPCAHGCLSRLRHAPRQDGAAELTDDADERARAPPTQSRAYRVNADEMLAIGCALLERAGASPKHARIVMDHLVDSSAMGLHSHGVMRIPQYLAEIAVGHHRSARRAEDRKNRRLASRGRWTARLRPGRRHADGRGARSARARDRHRHGERPPSRSHRPHRRLSGSAGEAGLVGLAVCNGAPSGHWVAAFGGRDGRISTNPIAVGWPVEGQPPVVADFSTATAPEGVIRVMRDRGTPAPEGYLRDADGGATRDPNVLYAKPKGAIQPLGGRSRLSRDRARALRRSAHHDAERRRRRRSFAQGHRHDDPGDRAAVGICRTRARPL